MIRENCYRCDGWGFLHDEDGHATLEGCPVCKDRGYLVRWGAAWAVIAEVCELEEEVSHQKETIRQLDMSRERLTLAEIGPCDEIRAVQAMEGQIVAWLRDVWEPEFPYELTPGMVADAIERGEHKEKEDGVS